MQHILLLVTLLGLVIFSGYKYYKATRARLIFRRRHH